MAGTAIDVADLLRCIEPTDAAERMEACVFRLVPPFSDGKFRLPLCRPTIGVGDGLRFPIDLTDDAERMGRADCIEAAEGTFCVALSSMIAARDAIWAAETILVTRRWSCRGCRSTPKRAAARSIPHLLA